MPDEDMDELEQDEDFEDEEDTLKDMYLTFHLAGEDYGLAIAYVIEIIGIQKITEVPDMPVFVKGVINLRGKVIPVIDVRCRFSLPPKEYDARTCIIVVNFNETVVGLVVDQVSEVISIPEAVVEPPPRISTTETSNFIAGLGKSEEGGVKILLDVTKLLFDKELGQLAA